MILATNTDAAGPAAAYSASREDKGWMGPIKGADAAISSLWKIRGG